MAYRLDLAPREEVERLEKVVKNLEAEVKELKEVILNNKKT